MYACIPLSAPLWTGLGGAGAPVNFPLAAEPGERISAIVGGGDAVSVLNRAMRSSVATSLAVSRSSGVRSRKRWKVGGLGGGAKGRCRDLLATKVTAAAEGWQSGRARSCVSRGRSGCSFYQC